MIDQPKPGDGLDPSTVNPVTGDAPVARAAESTGGARIALPDDFRIGIHEASHGLAARSFGSEVGGITIIPNGTTRGLMWGPKYNAKLEVEPFYEKVRDYLPRIGEDKTATPELFGIVHMRCIELVAGSVGEEIFFPNEPPLFAMSDIRESMGFASLVCGSVKSVEAFLAYIKIETLELLQKHKTAVRMIAEALVVKGTLSGEEVDEIILQAEARDALGAEHARRRQWSDIERRAAEFRTTHSISDKTVSTT